MELLKMLSANELVAQIISFLILFFLLRAFAWKPILKVLDERGDHIASELKEIEEQKQAALKAKADFEGKLSSIEVVAKVKIQGMMEEAEKSAQRIKDDAQREAARIIIKAEANTKYEAVKAKEEIKDEVANLVLGAAELLLEEKVTSAQDKKLVNEFLDKLDRA
ncbi:MAG: F0F1 ATP synthase subunit B [Candidatus Omnitrophica bacterium]|nr:F0F1 ATP synthase subunit B [Candidatus Omnitrophota bacterium]